MHYGVFGLSVFVRLIPLAVFYYSSSARKITRELTILEGQPPSILEQSNLIEIHFAIIFIFKPKLKNPKNALLNASFLNVFFPRPYSDTRLWLVD